MAMTHQLTPDQETMMQTYSDKWVSIGLSTGRADRDLITFAISQFYVLSGLAAPEFVWCESPVSMILSKHVMASVGDSVWASVRASVMASVGDSVTASVWDSVGASVRASVMASVRNSVGASVRASVGDPVKASVGDSVGASVRDCYYGSFDVDWLAFYEYMRDVLGIEYNEYHDNLFNIWCALNSTCGWWLPCENVCFVSDTAEQILIDDRGQLHSESGMAIKYSDGWGVYAWHGHRVDEQIIMRPESITVEQIDNERNVETRRIMIERYGGVARQQSTEMTGAALYVQDSGIEAEASDSYGTLYRKRIADDEDIVMVKVTDPSTGREYYNRVPPGIRTPLEAIAWRHYKGPDTYVLEDES